MSAQWVHPHYLRFHPSPPKRQQNPRGGLVEEARQEYMGALSQDLTCAVMQSLQPARATTLMVAPPSPERGEKQRATEAKQKRQAWIEGVMQSMPVGTGAGDGAEFVLPPTTNQQQRGQCDMGQEVKDTPFLPSHEKYYTVVLKF